MSDKRHSSFKGYQEVNLRDQKLKSIDITLQKSIELLDQYNNMNEYYDDVSAKRVLHDAEENELEFKGEN